MKFSCTKENIKQGLSNVAHIAGKNVNLPILSNVLIKASENTLQLIATDLEIGVQANIRGKVEAPGEFTVQAKLLLDYINLLPNERIDFELQENELKITCKNYKTKIKGENPEDYPVIPQVEEKNVYSIDFSEFKRGVAEVLFSVANNETRIELSGVYVEFNQNSIVLAATDSYRLAERKLSYKNKNEHEERKVIIPAKTLQEVIRFSFGGSEDVLSHEHAAAVVNIFLSDNQILFSYDDIKLVSRVIEGQYPDYRQIIPNAEQKKTSASFNRQELIRAIKASSLFSKNNVNDVNLDFSGGQNKVVVSSLNAQSGESVIEVSAGVDGPDTGIVLNYRYLLDGLSILDCENVVLEVMDASTPCVLKADGRSDYLYIIMPIRQ
ncbi:DNA polymerase III subunit beta [Candidatus Falkowbacteria bacterium RIFOXYC2_FULL_47_12]|uniref:Beta sliding clamp n=2 Tax=Candidatus Falkowiibacteriota TaxID=1752728 RepID=A0A1F5TMG1_9BACT|nr:MAG: DNA polymerase III subunit beta [Candidatus Falkowbacteria bacterium RIFOXYA2_FULL_47_9]OGF40142.1 MAG: DNA polymerase III subunit beta [Candidatus Falkowbacteria bacterium RIFOXYC2_FULL_47_12]